MSAAFQFAGFQPGSFAVQEASRSWLGSKDLCADPYRDYQADPTGVSLSTTAFLKARDKAEDFNVPFVIPPAGKFRIDETIEFTRMVAICGAGKRYPVIYEGSESAFRFLPPAIADPFGSDDDGTGHIICDLAVSPATSGAGKHGVEVILENDCGYGYWRHAGLFIGPFGLEGYCLDGTNQGNGNCFVGVLEHSFISNGLKGIKLGDSIVFNRVKVHGDRNVNLTGIAGQREIIWRDGQVTTRGGFFDLHGLNGFRLQNMWCEHPSYLGDYTGPYQGTAIMLTDCLDAEFLGGDVLGVHQGPGDVPAHVIACAGSTADVKIRDESFINRGSESHVYATSSTSNIKCAVADNKFNGITPVVVLQGS